MTEGRGDRRGVVAVGAAAMAMLALRLRQGVAPRGFHGVEYERHVQRLGLDSDAGLSSLAAFEGARQSAVLHWLAARLDGLTGGEPAAVQAAAGPLGLLALSTAAGLTAHRLLDDRRVGWWTAGGVLALPPLLGAAVRYDHDLPAAAATWAVLALLAAARGWTLLAAGAAAGVGLTLVGLLSWSTMPLAGLLAAGLLLGHPADRRVRTAAFVALLAGFGASLRGWLAQSSDSMAGMAEAFDADPPETGLAALLAMPLPEAAAGFPVRVLESLGSPPLTTLGWYALATLGALSPVLAVAVAPAVARTRHHPARRGLGGLALGAGLGVLLLTVGIQGADDRLLLPLLPLLPLAAAAGLTTLPPRVARLRAAPLAALGLLVSGEAAFGPAAPWNRPVAAFESVDARPALRLRGLMAASSVDGRGWTRGDAERPARSALRAAVWERVEACGWSQIAVLTWVFDDHGEQGWWDARGRLRERAGGPGVDVLQRQRWGGHAFWWDARDARDRLDAEAERDEPAFPTDETGVVGAPEPDAIVLAIEGGEPPDLRPLEGGRWSLTETIEDPAGGLPVGIWTRGTCSAGG